MESGILYRTGTSMRVLACALSFCSTFAPQRVQATSPFPGMSYCSVPPMAGFGVKPNLLLMLDNSASMYDLAYTDPPAYCVDDGYLNDKSYGGYFDQKAIYSYDFAEAKFVPGAQLPPATTACAGECIGSTSYLYLEMAGDVPYREVSVFKASGNFLNWLSMSKLDLEKEVLTGGKFLSDGAGSTGVLVAESRGCQGKRFVKIARDLPQITFGVRGPIPSEGDFLYRASHGGGTRIEIYDKPYNKAGCLSAVSDWQSKASLSTLRHDTLDCLGPENLVESDDWGAEFASTGKVFIDIMSACYANTPPHILTDGTLVDDCSGRVSIKYGNDFTLVPENAGDDFCAGNISHVLSGNPPNSKGYLGNCWKVSDKKFIYDDPCNELEAEDYCRDMTTPALTDPAGGNLNLPSFILDAGIYSVGPVSATLRVRVSASSPPSGLIQEFSGDINFGAMIFNDNGSGTECKSENTGLANGGLADTDIPCIKHCRKGATDVGQECHLDDDCKTFAGYTCQELPRTDGGKIISPLNAPLGDHTQASGLIAAIDQVTANSWTPLAESFYTAMGYFANGANPRLVPLQTGDFTTLAPSNSTCQRNNILIVSDGVSSADRNPQVNALVAQAAQDWVNSADNMPQSKTTVGNEDSPPMKGSYNLDDLAWIARHKNIADFSRPIGGNRDYLSTYVVYTGAACDGHNPNGTCTTADEGVPEKMMQLTAAKGGGKMAVAQNPASLKKAFGEMLLQVAAGSGSDASILSTGNGSGALFLQQQFYPTRSFDGGLSSASWIGEMQSLWYYIDPFLGGTSGAGSTIREDSDGDFTLNLKKDRIVSLRYDAGSNQTNAYLTADTNGDGLGEGEGEETLVAVEKLKSLWRSGETLWARDLTGAPRTILTPLLPGGSPIGSSGLMKFSFETTGSTPDHSALLQPYLQTSDRAGTVKLMRYVHGFDVADFRSRTVSIGSIPASAADPANKGVGVWKLGDIISSTPQLQSSVPLGSYHLATPKGYSDKSYLSFINSESYRTRGMVYAGANDGMLHAFSLGRLGSGSSVEQKATLAGSELGKEQWAFIPKNALPYLGYLTDPGYRHLYYIDGVATLVDASIGESWDRPKTAGNWRTVLIGGMGLGGATARVCATGESCVPTPIADPASPAAGFGYSSYFALDVTDANNPTLLWEFSNPGLGFSTTGPAIVRIGDPSLNGKWFAVFGSGPTGPIDTAKHQFLGNSNQELKFFVVDLRTGELAATILTGIGNAFSGTLSGASIDADRWNGSYQDDALYAGYTQKGSDGNWSGGVLRILTNEDPDPKKWVKSTLIEGVGPVTSGVAKLRDSRKNGSLWLYFGTGRYFYSQDDMLRRASLFGVKDPCYNFRGDGVVRKPDTLDATCTVAAGGGLIDQTSAGHDLVSAAPAWSPVGPGDPGWRIDLDAAAGANGAERLVTSPASITGGAVFFTTFQPSTDPCLFGNSYLWEVKYDTGGALVNTVQGKALVQLSTGGMQESTLGGNLPGKDGRRSSVMTGKPAGVKVVSNSGLKPVKKIIHIQER